MWRDQEPEYDGQDDYAYQAQAREAGYQGGYAQDSPVKQSGKFDEAGTRDKVRAQKEDDRNFYLQQFKQAEFQEEQRRRQELDKKARAKQEMAEHYQRQIQEKKERELQAKLQDAHFSRSTAENSTFASQDRQREQFLNKLKTGPTESQVVPQYVNRNTQKTDIFNQNIGERAPVQKQQFNDPNLDKLDQKKRMEREIFLENQKIANQKKVNTVSQRSEQKYQEREKAQNDYNEYERQQAMNRYSQAVQQKETFSSLQDQIRSKEVPVDDRRGGYGQQSNQYSAHNDFLAGDSKLGYLKNKQRAGGAGYNILTGM